ncbi:alkylation response protein AidB-like acyl-CoA dehydrogenase [Actinopolyspora lacussalsi]|nr:alkylation response protein AidB-like acyl-CoA dehydrogenase [Actinopolyspora lacussalsi]
MTTVAQHVSETNLPAEALTTETLLERVHVLAPTLRERAQEIEQHRCLPRDIVTSMREAGVFRMNMPRSWGGPELTSAQQIEVIEALAKADASVAWCAMIGADSGIYSGYLPDEKAREMFPRLDMITAGWIHPEGVAERVAGGYRVSGRWRFGSGCTHADWLVAGCKVYSDGEPESDPRGNRSENWRIMVARPEDFEILDTWHTTGLAGSGSRDYTVENLFVPEERSFSLDEPRRDGPLHAAPDTILRKMAGVPLGVARAAIDYVRELAESRVDRATGDRWADKGRVQNAVATAEIQLSSARAAVFDSVHQQWEKLVSGTPQTAYERAAVALARYNAFRVARDIVNSLYDLVGGAAIYRTASPLDRWLRDCTTMCQHAVGQEQIVTSAGQLLLTGHSDSLFL